MPPHIVSEQTIATRYLPPEGRSGYHLMVNNQHLIPAGTKMGPYTLLKPLGTGATATVYQAEDASGLPAAVKVREKQDDAMDRRFLREFESMRLLRVPGVVRVHKAGIQGNHLWFSMDRVFGKPFYDSLHAEPYLIERVERTILLGQQLCSIVGQLHDADFIHRDIKPTNVLVDTGDNVHVLDFGIGSYFADSGLSQTGMVLGTVPYMAPEQLGGLRTDHKVDSFALGLMLWEAIAGQRTPPATTLGWVPKLMLERLVPLACLFKEVPRRLSTLIERLLHVDPMQRPSAKEAAYELSRVAKGRAGPDWPFPESPSFNYQIKQVRSVIDGGGPPIWVLCGNSGSGRAALAERLHRQCLVGGRWPVHLQCRIDRIGKPLLNLAEVVIDTFNEEECQTIFAEAAPVLLATWPHLQLRNRDQTPANPVQALADWVVRLTAYYPLLLVFHRTEQVDALTARWMEALATRANDRLGLLILHEQRWATSRSNSLLHRLPNSAVLQTGTLHSNDSEALLANLCPFLEHPTQSPKTYVQTLEVAWKHLAQWRSEPFETATFDLWPLSIATSGVPTSLYSSLTGAPHPTQYTVEHKGMVRLWGRSARMMVNARTTSVSQAASGIAKLWLNSKEAAQHTGQIGALWLKAGEPDKAYLPLALAAIDCEQLGQFLWARKGLLVLDSLPAPKGLHHRVRFALLKTRASIALRTDLRNELQPLADAVAQAAQSEDEHAQSSLINAQLQLRQGNTTSALVSSLKIASAPNVERITQINAIFTAVRCRMALHQTNDAVREIQRVRSLCANTSNKILQCRARNAEASLAILEGDLQRCQELCDETIRVAKMIGYRRGHAYASHRLAQLNRMLGRRRDAESYARSALAVSEANSDLILNAEASLVLAALLVERGDSLQARRILDETTRRVRDLSLGHLLSQAMSVALYLGVVTCDSAEINMAMSYFNQHGSTDESSAIIVQHWRIQGDYKRAMKVKPPRITNGFAWARYALERSRCHLAVGNDVLSRREAALLIRRCKKSGYAEIMVFAKLLLGKADWKDTQRRAAESAWTDLFLGAIELDARRLATTDPQESKRRWSALAARAYELGYQPAVNEARGWLNH